MNDRVRATHQDCGEEKWEAQSERVRGEENRGVINTGLTSCHGQDRAEDRAYARRPTSAECNSDQERGSQLAFWQVACVKSSFSAKERYFDDADLVQPEQNKENAADPNQPISVAIDDASG